MTTILQPPILDHDVLMKERFGTEAGRRGRIERRVVWNLLHHLHAAGFELRTVFDSDDTVKLEGAFEARALAAMNQIFNLDECYLHVGKPGYPSHYIFLVMGNDGWDVIADNSYFEDDRDGFRAAMDAFDPEAYA